MSARRGVAPRSVSRVQDVLVEDPVVARALDRVVSSVQDLQEARRRVVVTADLVVGTNRIPHGLGRACQGYTLTPMTADATFAHALDKTNPRADLEVWITVVGVAQTAAVLEVY